MPQEKEKVPGFFYLKIFILVVVLLVLGSVLVKIAMEVVESTFTSNSYSLLLVGKDSKLLYVDKNLKTVHYLSLGDIRPYVKGKNPLGASISLGIPINAMILDDKVPGSLSEFSSSENEMRLIFSSSIPFRKVDKFDIFKLMGSVRGAPKDNKIEARVNIFDQKELREKVGEGFKDSVTTNMPYTIEIDNGTSINGLGSIVALILGRQGYNVIAVRTSNETSNSYIAYDGEKNLFINSLIGLTGFDFQKRKVSQSADITIYLGDDLDAMLSP